MFQRKIRTENYVKERETSLDLLSTFVLVVEFHFGAMLCSNLGNEMSGAGITECSRGQLVPPPLI